MTSQDAVRCALSFVVLFGLGAGAVLSAAPSKAGCFKSAEVMITAEGAAYDALGGAKIGYLSPPTKYVSVTTLRHLDGERWMLLTGPGGAHAGWIMASAVRRTHFGISCSMSDLYKGPQ